MSNNRLAGLTIIIILLLNVSSARALTEDDVRADLAKAYEAVARAEAVGVRVENMVSELDDVARKISGSGPATLEVYKLIVDSVVVKARSAEVVGVRNETNRLYSVVAVVAIIIVLGGVLLGKGSRWFWGAWLWVHRGWRVERI